MRSSSQSRLLVVLGIAFLVPHAGFGGNEGAHGGHLYRDDGGKVWPGGDPPAYLYDLWSVGKHEDPYFADIEPDADFLQGVTEKLQALESPEVSRLVAVKLTEIRSVNHALAQTIFLTIQSLTWSLAVNLHELELREPIITPHSKEELWIIGARRNGIVRTRLDRWLELHNDGNRAAYVTHEAISNMTPVEPKVRRIETQSDRIVKEITNQPNDSLARDINGMLYVGSIEDPSHLQLAEKLATIYRSNDRGQRVETPALSASRYTKPKRHVRLSEDRRMLKQAFFTILAAVEPLSVELDPSADIPKYCARIEEPTTIYGTAKSVFIRMAHFFNEIETSYEEVYDGPEFIGLSNVSDTRIFRSEFRFASVVDVFGLDRKLELEDTAHCEEVLGQYFEEAMANSDWELSAEK